MKLSPQAIDQIKAAEGYHTRLKDGRCKSYLCPAGKWTIGWGCTEGVGPGMVWTKEQAEEALAVELAKVETAVGDLVKRPITQAQFDCLVSFAFNVGTGQGGLGGSTLLKLLNKGAADQVPTQLLRWVMHVDPKTKRKVPSAGLRNRRLREIRMWHGEHLPEAPPIEETLPQAAAPADGATATEVLTKSGTVTGILGGALAGAIALFQDAVSVMTEAATQLAGMGPARAFLAEMGVSLSGVTAVFGAASLAYALQRRFRAGKEGKIG